MFSMGASFPLRSDAIVVHKALPCRSRRAHVLQRTIAPLAISTALLLTVATSGWLVLRNMSTGTGALEIRLNWTAIFALGVPLVGFAFLLVWLFIRVALSQNPHDTVS